MCVFWIIQISKYLNVRSCWIMTTAQSSNSATKQNFDMTCHDLIMFLYSWIPDQFILLSELSTCGSVNIYSLLTDMQNKHKIQNYMQYKTSKSHQIKCSPRSSHIGLGNTTYKWYRNILWHFHDNDICHDMYYTMKVIYTRNIKQTGAPLAHKLLCTW